MPKTNEGLGREGDDARCDGPQRPETTNLINKKRLNDSEPDDHEKKKQKSPSSSSAVADAEVKALVLKPPLSNEIPDPCKGAGKAAPAFSGNQSAILETKADVASVPRHDTSSVARRSVSSGRQKAENKNDTGKGDDLTEQSAETTELNARTEPYSMILEPDTKPISLAQLINEVKGIYVGLVLVETKCIEIDAEQRKSTAELTDEQWQALHTLHRTLLHEHHDFMLASQHPSASPALRRLAQKYAMPARMWRHAIHSFLELLRHRLPASQEHMVAFIYLAYSMMALLYETIPAFEETWVECLGDLSRYRMAIEDDNARLRESWAAVSKHWYTIASDKAPTTGRLYHHLAILARPNIVTQLYLYTKSLCVPTPFTSTRESVLTLFDPILSGATLTSGSTPRMPQIDIDFTKLHAILFTGKHYSQFDSTMRRFLKELNMHIATTARQWVMKGSYIAIVLCCSLLNYGSEDNAIMQILKKQPAITAETDDAGSDIVMTEVDSAVQPLQDALRRPLLLTWHTDRIIFDRLGDPNCFAYIHVRLVWLVAMAEQQGAMASLENHVPWTDLVGFLNHLATAFPDHSRYEKEQVMVPLPEVQEEQNPPRILLATEPSPPRQRSIEEKPLPEEWNLRGLIFTQKSYPKQWFKEISTTDGDEKYMEAASMPFIRKERILWLAFKLAKHRKWISYDMQEHLFSVLPIFKASCEKMRSEYDVASNKHEYGFGGGNDEDDDIILSDLDDNSLPVG